MPILGLPLTYEQNLNARIVRDKHIGTIINYREVDEDTLENEIKGLLENQTVRVNVAKLSSLVNDSRTSPVEVSTAIQTLCMTYYPRLQSGGGSML